MPAAHPPPDIRRPAGTRSLPASRALATAAAALLTAAGLVAAGDRVGQVHAVGHHTIEAATATALLVDVDAISFPGLTGSLTVYRDQVFLRDLVIVAATWAGTASLGASLLAAALFAQRPRRWLAATAAAVLAARLLWVDPTPPASLLAATVTPEAQRATWWAFTALAAGLGAAAAALPAAAARGALACVGTIQLAGTLTATRHLATRHSTGRSAAWRLHDVIPALSADASAWLIRGLVATVAVSAAAALVTQTHTRTRSEQPRPQLLAAVAIVAAIALGAAAPPPAHRLAHLPTHTAVPRHTPHRTPPATGTVSTPPPPTPISLPGGPIPAVG